MAKEMDAAEIVASRDYARVFMLAMVRGVVLSKADRAILDAGLTLHGGYRVPPSMDPTVRRN